MYFGSAASESLRAFLEDYITDLEERIWSTEAKELIGHIRTLLDFVVSKKIYITDEIFYCDNCLESRDLGQEIKIQGSRSRSRDLGQDLGI